MKARYLAAALLLAPAPASAVTVDWTFTATPGVIEAGQSVDLRLSYAFGTPDPRFLHPGFDGGLNITFYDGMGHERSFFTDRLVTSWTFTYPEAGSFWASFYVYGRITQQCAAGTQWIGCPGLVHSYHSANGGAEVLVVPGPAVGAGLPGLLMLLTLWRRRRCSSRSC